MRKSLRKPFLILYFIALHIVLAAVLWKSDFIEKVQTKLRGENPSEITPHFHRMLAYHKRMDGNVPTNSTVFIGDSITQGLCVSAVSQPSVNYGIGSDTTVGVLQRIDSYRSIKDAKAVVLAIGINDMKFRSNAEIRDNIASIRSRIPMNIPVLISGVLPIDPDARNDPTEWRKERIGSLNEVLEDLAKNTQNTFFVDAGSQLADAGDELMSAFHTGDGVHLNSEGNRVWIAVLKESLNKIEQAGGHQPDTAR